MFKNIWLWLTNALGKIAKVAVDVVNVIKEWVNNPLLDIITTLTQSKVDDNILAVIRENLPRILKGVLLGEKVVSEIKDGSFKSLFEIFKGWMNDITPESRGKWWAELAAIIVNIISSYQLGKPLAKSYAVEITQKVYRKG